MLDLLKPEKHSSKEKADCMVSERTNERQARLQQFSVFVCMAYGFCSRYSRVV